jgi:chromosome partitioning protein
MFLQQSNLRKLAKVLRDIPIFDAVPKSVRFAESNLAGEPIHIYAEDSKLIAPYQAIVNTIILNQ